MRTEQLAGTLGQPPEKVAKLLSLVPEISSLDAPTGDGDGTVGQLLPDRAARGPQDILVQAQLLQAITSLMAQLTQRQQQILRMHYGLDDGVCHSLEDIAGQLGISKERVRQVEKQAFEKMPWRLSSPPPQNWASGIIPTVKSVPLSAV